MEVCTPLQQLTKAIGRLQRMVLRWVEELEARDAAEDEVAVRAL